jgi:hypothetical protein
MGVVHVFSSKHPEMSGASHQKEPQREIVSGWMRCCAAGGGCPGSLCRSGQAEAAGEDDWAGAPRCAGLSLSRG